MSYIVSPNMNLQIPTVGSESGPQFSYEINTSLSLIDSHDHTPGRGVQLTPSSLNMNATLPMNGNFITGLAGLTLVAQGSIPANNTIYESGVDLFFVDGVGNNVRITQSGGIAGSPGSIANLTAPASASYVSASKTFVWQSDTNIAANMDFASATLRNITPNSTNGVTLSPPDGLSSSYTITLPVLPLASSFLSIDPTGIMTASPSLSQGITASNIANGTITATQISPTADILGTQLADNTVTLQQLGTTVLQENIQTFNITAASFNARAATTTAGTLSTSFANGSVIDGVTLATNDIILIKNQTVTTDDGVYVVQVSGAPTRQASYSTFSQINYAAVHITNGTANANTNYYQNNILSSFLDPQSWSKSQTIQFTVPTNVNYINILGVGGGGAGGGNSNSTVETGTGGGGSTPMKTAISVNPGDIINVTVGFKGEGALDSAGQDSLVSYPTGSLLFKGGQQGFPANIGTGGQTYYTSVYSPSLQVLSAGIGSVVNGTAGNDAVPTFYAPTPAKGGASGGGSFRGGGAGGSGLGPGANGSAGNPLTVNNAVNPGSGGGGAGAFSGNPSTSGGDGANGQIIFSWLGAP